MMNNKFESKQELDNYIKNNSTSFEEFEKQLDYSKLNKVMNKNKKHKGFSWKKLGYALASLVLVIGVSLGIHFASTIWSDHKCPYELGTYTYYSQKGNIDGLDFDSDSYIILTDQKIEGPGTFILESDEWTSYGQFKECEFETVILERISENDYEYTTLNYDIEIFTENVNECKMIIVKILSQDAKMELYYRYSN